MIETMTRLVHRGGAPPAHLVLAPDSVDVWTVTLDEAGPTAPVACLSPEERARADRFVAERDRRRFVRAHGALRAILAAYLGAPPSSVAVVTGPWGKPTLDPARHGSALRYNLSHSHEVALVVVARDRDVGVDVEQIRPLPDLEAIAARFFAPGERAGLACLAADRRPAAFFALWTLKEAYLKARGEGFGRPPESVEITLDAGHDRARVRHLDRVDDGRRWELFPLRQPAGYAAAVAIAVT
jgi:4'-phosphopantetheinyl transferase